MFDRLITDMRAVGCRVTITKTLVWIDGNTYAIKDSLKTAGWKWSAKKRAWWMTIAQYLGTESPSKGADYALMGTAADGTPVVVAECHHGTAFADDDNYGFNPWTD